MRLLITIMFANLVGRTALVATRRQATQQARRRMGGAAAPEWTGIDKTVRDVFPGGKWSGGSVCGSDRHNFYGANKLSLLADDQCKFSCHWASISF